MPDTHSYWRMDCPPRGYPPISTETGVADRPCHLIAPEHNLRRYAYPLLLIFPDQGRKEESTRRLIATISRRNFASVVLSGAVKNEENCNDSAGYSWPQDDDDLVDYIQRALKTARLECTIHSERIYLVGLRDGAQAAYRAAFQLGDKVAGVIALNGALPTRSPGMPLFDFHKVRPVKFFLAHGIANRDVPISQVEAMHRLLSITGCDSRLQHYAVKKKIDAEMLRDVNRWIMNHINSPSEVHLPHVL